MATDKDESIRIIRSGIDQGINYIDTGWLYHLGESEKILGLALKDGFREKVKLVSTKGKLDRENPNGNVSMCVECGKCLEKCPQGINKPVELTKTHAILGKREPIAQHYVSGLKRKRACGYSII